MADNKTGGRPAADVHDSLLRLIAEVGLEQRTAPTSKTEIAVYCRVDPATLWRHGKKNTAIADMVEQLLATGQSVHGQPGEEGSAALQEDLELVPQGKAPLADLSAEDLAHCAAKPVRLAQSAAERWAARSRKVRYASDLPAAIYHLQMAHRQLGKAIDDLTPFAEEWLRRSRQGGGVGGDAQLSWLEEMDEER